MFQCSVSILLFLLLFSQQRVHMVTCPALNECADASRQNLALLNLKTSVLLPSVKKCDNSGLAFSQSSQLVGHWRFCIFEESQQIWWKCKGSWALLVIGDAPEKAHSG